MSMAKRLVGRIDYHPFKRALNHYLARPAGGKRRPAYWDIDAVCLELWTLEPTYPRIRAEVDALLDDQVAIPACHDINTPSTEIAASTQGRWSVFMLGLLGYRARKNLARCPKARVR